ncbi:MAG TPA: wax ester/triacylglycerol synthase family O-acyltransferase [Thermoleophilaceae bacterium]|nr:wax ester/triacylglycerol synthase family O-acyltransferase [Thermoleophilaceae bacterium]
MGPRVRHAAAAREARLTRPLALSPADLSAIQAEQGPVHMHVGGVLVFGGRVTAASIAERIDERIHLIPHYRMRLMASAPLGLSHPVWEDHPGFRAADHLRAVRWPEPGDDAALCRVVGEAMSVRLPRDRPLWELLVIDSPSRGVTAVLARMHHALVDGIAAIGVGTIILDPTPEKLELPPPEGEPEERRLAWVRELRALMPDLGPDGATELIEPLLRRSPELEPPGRAELRRLMTAQLDVPRRLAGGALSKGRDALDPRRAAKQARDAVGLMRDLARARPQAPDTRLNRGIGAERAFALARGELATVKAIREAAGATVNDVILTAVALMLSEFLAPDVPDRTVALVPVSVRGDEHEGELGNRISTVFVDLPMRGEPLERLAAVSAVTRDLKDSAEVRTGALIVGAAGLAPPAVSALTARALGAPRLFNLVVSNVPGPQQTFYLDGVPLRETFPAVPLNPRNQGLSIGVLSYDGSVNFGLLADAGTVSDVASAAESIERALGDLAEAAGV